MFSSFMKFEFILRSTLPLQGFEYFSHDRSHHCAQVLMPIIYAFLFRSDFCIEDSIALNYSGHFRVRTMAY